MHALIIGGSGRTGKLVIDELLQRGTVLPPRQMAYQLKPVRKSGYRSSP